METQKLLSAPLYIPLPLVARVPVAGCEAAAGRETEVDRVTHGKRHVAHTPAQLGRSIQGICFHFSISRGNGFWWLVRTDKHCTTTIEED